MALVPDFSSSPVSGSSATLKPVTKSGGSLAPNTGNNYYSVAPKTTPAPTTSTAMQVGGWYGGRQWDGSRLGAPGEVIVGGSSTNPFNSVGVTDYNSQINAEIDRAANALNDVLNKQEEYLKGEDYNSGVEDINRNIQQATDNLAARKRESDIQSASDEDLLGKSYSTAQGDAVRSYNALQQRARALFGRGSSAGQAGTEIAQEAYYKQQGGIGEAFINQEGMIRARAAQVAREYDDNLKELDNQKTSFMAALKKNLSDKLMEIASQRGQIEANKSAQRLAVLQAAQNQVAQLKAYDTQMKANIQQAIAEKMLNINNDFSAIAKQYNIDTTNTPYVQFSTDPTKYGAITYQSPDAIMNLLARAPRNTQDDLNTTNPFYA